MRRLRAACKIFNGLAVLTAGPARHTREQRYLPAFAIGLSDTNYGPSQLAASLRSLEGDGTKRVTARAVDSRSSKFVPMFITQIFVFFYSARPHKKTHVCPKCVVRLSRRPDEKSEHLQRDFSEETWANPVKRKIRDRGCHCCRPCLVARRATSAPCSCISVSANLRILSPPFAEQYNSRPNGCASGSDYRRFDKATLTALNPSLLPSLLSLLVKIAYNGAPSGKFRRPPAGKTAFASFLNVQLQGIQYSNDASNVQMALNFFDYDQLAKGAHAGEQEDERSSSGRATRKRSIEENKGSDLQIRVPELRKLHSETALRAHAKGLNSPLTPRSPHSPLFQRSRPATSQAAQQDQKGSSSTSHGVRKEKRPDTSRSHGTDVPSDPPARRKSLTRSFRSLRRQRSSSKSREHERHDKEHIQGGPGSSSEDRGKSSKPKSGKDNGISAEPQTTRSRTNTMRSKAANLLQQLTSLTASKLQQPGPQPPVPTATSALSARQAQFLAESLAHVTVGEWLFKDHNRPSLVPRTNPFRRHVGPPPRGSTGLPQRRWFRISPYERKMMWSSKWDASSLDQLKSSRQVPVNLVFETPSNVLFAECLPTHLLPFKRSIVIVAPQRIVKVTAPDEDRHRLWLTALRYIADSTVKLDEEHWATELRARFEVLSSGDLSVPYASGGLERPILHEKLELAEDARTKHISSNFFTEKPLPPSPRTSTLSRSTAPGPALTPPVVPRFVKHGQQRSEGISTMAESDIPISIRPSADDPMPALPPEFSQAGPSWRDDALGRERKRESEPGLESQRSASVPRKSESEPETRDEPGNRDSRRLTSDEFAVDQIEMLVDRLGAI